MDMINIKNINKIYNKGSEIIQSFTNTDTNNQILDPISCIIKLGMLNFKNRGCKISIHNNKISFNEPVIYQGILRWHYSYSRNDLHNLNNPIKKIEEWYDTDIIEIQNIINISINGITNLKESYEGSSIINHTLERYVDILKEIISNKNNTLEDFDNKQNILKKNNLQNSCYIDNQNNEENNVVINEIQKLWSYREIKIVNGIFEELIKKKEKKIDFDKYLNSLEIIVESKEEEVSKLIKNACTIL